MLFRSFDSFISSFVSAEIVSIASDVGRHSNFTGVIAVLLFSVSILSAKTVPFPWMSDTLKAPPLFFIFAVTSFVMFA